MEISKQEKELLEQYQKLPETMLSLVNRLAVEVVPSIIFVLMGLYTGHIVWFLVLIALMVIYNIQRVLRQYKNIVKLRSISKKVLRNVNE